MSDQSQPPAPPAPPSPAEVQATVYALIEALHQLNHTLRQIGGLLAHGPRGVIREQTLQPPMPPLVAQQWPRRDGDNFPRGT